MSKRHLVLSGVLSLTIVGYGILNSQKISGQTQQSTGSVICNERSTVAVDGKPQEKVLACDDFNSQTANWTASNGVSHKDISNGSVLLLNRHEDARPGAEPTTQLVYLLGEPKGDLTVEVRFEDFLSNPNSRFQLEVQGAPGNALDLGRWSAGGKQYLQFQVIADSESKLATQVEYNHSSGVLKAQYIAKSGELRAFYKETSDGEYKEMSGSPFVHAGFSKGPYIAVLYSHNFDAGGPASVKIDWVKISARANQEIASSQTGTNTESQTRPQPKRPADFKPFNFRYSTEELRQKFSAQVMSRAKKEMGRVNRINQKGPYKPTWISLDAHQLPEWFRDAKFGMFIDWGLYSVPAYAPSGYPDWYLHRMIYGDTKQYHEQVWGKDFARDDFIPLFTASKYDPELLVKAAQAGGMKYVIPFAKHHDGFALWPSSYTFRDAADMGPKRDLIKPLADACRRAGLKFGFYFSLDEWEHPMIDENGKLAIRMWDTEPRFKVNLVPYSPTEFQGKISGKIPLRDFYNDLINPQAIEFIDKYDPDILWFDGDWVVGADERNSRAIVAYFYNRAQGRKEVVVNDRMGLSRLVPTAGQDPSAKPHGDYYTSEYAYETGKDPGFQRYWEETNGLSASFGYNWQETNDKVRSTHQVIEMLVDVVSSGGNLLLITNLTGEGKLDPLLVERLNGVGAWLQTNGEAIYATRPWKQFKQGEDIRFTRSKDGKYVYAVALKWPGESLILQSLKAKPGSSVIMLGRKNSLQWRQDGNSLVIELPQDLSQTPEAAWAFRIEQ